MKNHVSIKFLTYLFKQFITNQGILNAAALTYTTLFAVVPLMTVSYAMLAAVPSFQGVGQELQGWVFQNFVPTTGAVVQDYLSEFSSQARNLTAVGVALLAVTSIMMMKNIEAAFNRIWRVSEPRKGLSSFLLYWAVLSLGPILIGLGLVVTSYIASLPFINSATEVVGKARLISILPTMLSATAFTLLYIAVPNCRVPFRSALIGGIVIALMFESAKRGFAAFVTQFPSYELIYGAFAAVPLFLLWIFISWVIILLGAELTRSLSIYRSIGHKSKSPHLFTILAIIKRLAVAQAKGQSLSDRVLLNEVEGLDQGRWDTYLQILLDGGVIKRTDQGEYLLSMDIHQLTVLDLQNMLPWPIPQAREHVALSGWKKELNASLQQLDQQKDQQLGVSLQSLFDEATEAKNDPSA